MIHAFATRGQMKYLGWNFVKVHSQCSVAQHFGLRRRNVSFVCGCLLCEMKAGDLHLADTTRSLQTAEAA